jgi:hypothetical protein
LREDVYQGTTLVVPKRPFKYRALAPGAVALKLL